MRERLIELINQAREECKLKESCIKCSGYGKGGQCISYLIADHLLDNGVIVPPCKVGDTVWCIIDGFNQVMEGRVRGFTAYENVINIYCGIKGYFERNYTDKEFGKTIFHAKEEAEAALVNYESTKIEKGGKEVLQKERRSKQ